MTLAHCQFSILDNKGNLVTGATVRVEKDITGTPLASIYSDRAGSSAMGNPYTCSDGLVDFYAVGGAYKITVTKDSLSQTYRYYPIGLAAESDYLTYGVPFLWSDAVTDSDPGAGYIKFDNATLASVTTLYIDNDSATLGTVSSWLDSLDDGGEASDRGHILVQDRPGSAYIFATITGSVVDGTGYRKISVTPIATGGTFVADSQVTVQAFRAGLDGVDGTDGDVGGPVTSTNSAFALWNGTGGDTLKDSSYIIATTAAVRAYTDNSILHAGNIEDAAAVVTLTDAATIALDWSSGINFDVTLTTDRILGNPSNAVPGTWRTVLVKSDGGPDELTFAANYKGTPPTLDDLTTSQYYLITIYCYTTSHFIVSSIDGSS